MNKRTSCLSLLVTLLVCTLCGCSAPRSQFVLLPSPDGHVGKVTVASKAGETKLDKAYETSDLSRPEDQPSPPTIMTEEKVNSLFKDALYAQPAVPVTYILYFEPSSSTLTQESQKLLPQIVEYIRTTAYADISISGHSDKVGSNDINIKISKERADAVAKLLTDMGIASDSLEVASYGTELPLFDTPEGVPEPRNRRVELVVR